ncbi:MAG: DUF4290 domain-containing protein [Bacteroidales bacterium]|nr:DUF4290 domain-containing protein [Bacteroidales bacterium]MDE6236876.1 DUF4290 domain-containing protein [Muribaculaceae bacterium]MDE6538066.1 DUF4290 domain-containing protein [Muribaculaceae bacterium]MDE6865964.1 DUF4290 domain-containing protein [Muribaculaceae bacterium]
MIPYNTDNSPIILPEFGRNVEGLVKYCSSIEDREERNNCAYALADVMSNLFPELIGEGGERSKIWDTMNIISGFTLDIDFPGEVISEERFHPAPERLPYTASPMRYRHYGKNIEKMIEIVAEMDESEEKDNLISMIAHHMKKLMLTHNKEGVDDAKILRDLAEYSNGRIDLDPSKYLLHEFKEVEINQNGKNKKKKK